MAPQNVSTQPKAAPVMEMTVQPTIDQAQCQNHKQGFAARIRGGGAGKDCLMGALACFLCCEVRLLVVVSKLKVLKTLLSALKAAANALRISS
ncbi:hypothetical protein FRC11_001097, partial [Ceratobasidium sp. 423]